MRVQVDIAELGHDQIEPVGLVEFGDVFLESEVLDNLSGARGKSLDIIGQICSDVVRVAF